jgi:hypothetical protein
MTLDERNSYLRNLQEQDFRELGTEHVAYIRLIDILGTKHYSIHQADGSVTSVASSIELAVSIIHEHEMDMVPLH